MSVSHFSSAKLKVSSKSGHNGDKDPIGWRVQASFDELRDLLFSPWRQQKRASSKKLLRLSRFRLKALASPDKSPVIAAAAAACNSCFKRVVATGVAVITTPGHMTRRRSCPQRHEVFSRRDAR